MLILYRFYSLINKCYQILNVNGTLFVVTMYTDAIYIYIINDTGDIKYVHTCEFLLFVKQNMSTNEDNGVIAPLSASGKVAFPRRKKIYKTVRRSYYYIRILYINILYTKSLNVYTGSF